MTTKEGSVANRASRGRVGGDLAAGADDLTVRAADAGGQDREVTFTSADRVRDVIHNFNTDGFAALYPKCKGGRLKTFTRPERREIKKIAKSTPTEHDLPF